MSLVSVKRTRPSRKPPLALGPDDNGLVLTPEEFDAADFDDDHHFELVNGVLIVSPIPSEAEADPNEELGHWLWKYQQTHPRGSCLDKTLPDRYVKTGRNRRRPDRVIWAGLGRPPRKSDPATILVEFVSAGKRNRERDYEEKRTEYAAINVQEYWIIDRFERLMTVFHRVGKSYRRRLIREHQTYTTKLLPGFELPLGKLLALAKEWAD